VLGLNVLLVPTMGYFGSAWAAFVAYFVIMVISYFFGQKYFPINYQLKAIGKYVLLAVIIFALGWFVSFHIAIFTYLFRTFLLLVFVFYALKHDFQLTKMPFINKLLHK
jgi:O-antigen/teichoic acid export membrane protein